MSSFWCRRLPLNLSSSGVLRDEAVILNAEVAWNVRNLWNRDFALNLCEWVDECYTVGVHGFHHCREIQITMMCALAPKDDNMVENCYWAHSSVIWRDKALLDTLLTPYLYCRWPLYVLLPRWWLTDDRLRAHRNKLSQLRRFFFSIDFGSWLKCIKKANTCSVPYKFNYRLVNTLYTAELQLLTAQFAIVTKLCTW